MPIIREAQMFLGVLEDGQLTRDLSETMKDVLVDLVEHAGPKGKAKGSVSLQVNFTVSGGTVEITSDLKSKKPKESRASTVLFVLPDGSLSTDHPKQMSMFPRDAEERRGAEFA